MTAGASAPVLLDAQGITKRFGGVHALADVDFQKIGRASCRERV